MPTYHTIVFLVLISFNAPFAFVRSASISQCAQCLQLHRRWHFFCLLVQPRLQSLRRISAVLWSFDLRRAVIREHGRHDRLTYSRTWCRSNSASYLLCTSARVLKHTISSASQVGFVILRGLGSSTHTLREKKGLPRYRKLEDVPYSGTRHVT